MHTEIVQVAASGMYRGGVDSEVACTPRMPLPLKASTALATPSLDPPITAWLLLLMLAVTT